MLFVPPDLPWQTICYISVTAASLCYLISKLFALLSYVWDWLSVVLLLTLCGLAFYALLLYPVPVPPVFSPPPPPPPAEAYFGFW